MKRNVSRLLVALTALAALAGCDRSPRNEAEPSTYTRNGPEQAPAAPSRTSSPRASAPPPLEGSGAPPTIATAAPRDTLTDTVITGKIKAAILADPGMEGADVSVNTDKGVVVLEGTVKSQDQTGIASAHAQRQDGVMRVDSHLAAVAP